MKTDPENSEAIETSLMQIKFQSDNFFIGSFMDNRSNFLNAMGNMVNPQVGMNYMLIGKWDDHPKYGEQFKFFSYETIMPIDNNGIFKYIVRICKFVGASIGNMIVDKYGDQTLIIMKTNPDKIANEIPGITLDRANKIQKSLLANEKDEKVMIELEEILDVPGMWKSLPAKLIKEYKNEAVEVVKFNPYILTSFRGIGFPLADRVALKNGTPRDDIERKKAAILHCLGLNMKEKGSIWIKKSELADKIKELIQVPKIEQGLDALFEEGILVIDEIGYSLFYAAANEMLIAKKVVGLVNSENLVSKKQGIVK